MSKSGLYILLFFVVLCGLGAATYADVNPFTWMSGDNSPNDIGSESVVQGGTVSSQGLSTDDSGIGFETMASGESSNNQVHFEDDDIKISTSNVTPNNQWAYTDITYKNLPGGAANVDLTYGVDTANLQFTQGEYFSPHNATWNTTHDQIFYNVSINGTYVNQPLDYGNSYNTHQYVVDHDAANGSKMERITSNISFDSISPLPFEDGGDYRILWHTEHSGVLDWKAIPNDRVGIIYYEHDGKNKWYVLQDIPAVENETIRLRAKVNTPHRIGSHSYKYDIATKLSADTITEAVGNNRFKLVDPYGTADNFNSTWNTTKTSTGSTNSTAIKLPLESGGTYNFTVWWGDGSNDTITVWNQANVTHNYSSAGEYDIVIDGNITGWRFNNVGDKLKILEISNWGNLNLGNAGSYFYGCSNLDVSATDTLDLTGTITLQNVFRGCTGLITLDVSNWDIGAVTTFADSFRGCSGLTALDISGWDTGAVTVFESAFEGCSGLTTIDTSGWDTGAVTLFEKVFYGCSGLTALNATNWNTANVTTFRYSFYNVGITEIDTTNWNVTSLTDATGMFNGVTLNTTNYGDLLVNFEAQAVQNNVPFHGGNSKYYEGTASVAKAALETDHTWVIQDGGMIYGFNSTWNTTKTSTGSTNSTAIKLPLESGGIYDFTVFWGDGSNDTITVWNQVNTTHNYSSAGEYDIVIDGDITGFRFNNVGDRKKIIDITNWGKLNLGNSNSYFYGCTYLNITATDTLNLTGTTNLEWAFRDAAYFNGSFDTWNTINVTNMQGMFFNAMRFNQSLASFDTSNVTNMGMMFGEADAFNGNVSSFNTLKVTTMALMFDHAYAFNQSVPFNTINVTSMTGMFAYANAFNQPISFNTANVTTMEDMFEHAIVFNQSVASFNTTKVIDMEAMFHDAYAFNQSVSSFNTTNVTTMYRMFYNANVFDQSLASFDTQNVWTMSYMFYGADVFNQSLAFNTTNVTTMYRMFRDSVSFDQDIGLWNISSLNIASEMFHGVTLSTSNYDALLTGWAGQAPSIQNGVPLHGGDSQYTAGAAHTARNTTLIGTYGWSIIDGGMETTCYCNVTNISGVWNFCNCSDIPTLHSAVNDEAVLEHNVTEDIYTLHEPFYQNTSTDAFNFNETVHLKSNVDSNPAYFNWSGTNIINNSIVIGWNTTSNSVATTEDNTRAWMYGEPTASGNITNSNFSYLGYNVDYKYGLYLEGYDNHLFDNNTFYQNYYGIFLYLCDNNDITNSTMSYNDLGIQLYDSDHNTLSDLVVHNNQYGIDPIQSDYNIITDCEVYSNQLGIYLEIGANYNDIINCDVHDNSWGVYFNTAHHNTVSDSFIYSSTDKGAYSDSAMNVTYTNNSCYSNQYGIYLTEADDSVLIDNECYLNDRQGILIHNSPDVNISDNNVSNNGRDGIYSTGSINGIFVNNTVDDDNATYYDYYFKSNSESNTITLTTKVSNNFSVDNTIDSLIFTDTINYTIGFPLVASVIQDNPPAGTEKVNITVINGTIDYINVTAGLSATTDYSSYYSVNDTEIEQQTTDGAGIANFTTNLNISTYYIDESPVCDCNVSNVSGVWKFDNCSNIPTLHTSVGDEAVLEYNASEDIYTFHEPFYMNVSTDTFYFNETVHLKSNVDSNPGYIQWAGTNIIDDSVILGWNTNTNSVATVSNSTRAWMYGEPGSSGNITDSNFSYLGYSTNHKLGVCLNGYTGQIIDNNTFSNNYDGLKLDTSSTNTVNNNIAFSNQYGIYVDVSYNNNFTDNYVYSNVLQGIYFYISPNNNITNITSYSNGQFGVNLFDSPGNSFTNITAYSNGYSGVVLSNSSNSDITDATTYSNGHRGIIVYNSLNHELTNITAYSNGRDGIHIDLSSNNILTDCNISDTAAGYYDYSFGTTAENNTITLDPKISNYFKVDNTINSIYINNGIDYTIGYPLAATVIQDNAPIGDEKVNITVHSGTIDYINVTSGLSATTGYQSKYQNNDTVIESQTTNGAGIANFTTDLTTGGYYIEEGALLTLLTPADSSTIYTTFPPLIDSVSFTWEDIGSPQYRVQIAEDSDFNVMAIDTHVSTNATSEDLMVNKQFWWKVTEYDGTVYGAVSSTFTFNLTANTTLTGAAIEGVAYTDVDGIYTVLEGVEISIWNSTWADFAITASNGYYKFENLAPTSVYSMQAKKDRYDDTAISLVSTTTDPVIKNFYLIVDRTTEEWWHYVKFTVWSLRGYHDEVLVNVYTGDATTITYTGFTGENVDGSITFVLDRQQEYTLTFVNATQGINKTLTLYPKDDSYLIFIAFPSSWDEYETPINTAIDIDVSTSVINSTAAYVNVSYTDSLAQTTAATVYLNQSNQSDPYNQTIIGSQAGLSGNWTHSFIVTNYSGESYYVHVVATHTTFGTVDKTYAVTFDDSIMFEGIPDKFWLYFSLFIMLFTGAMFTATTVQQGSMVLCIEGWVFLALGWFDTADPTLIGVGLGFATVFAILANINKKTKKEGIE